MPVSVDPPVSPSAARHPGRRPRRAGVALWVAQAALAVLLVGGGIFKLVTPVQELADSFAWAAEVPAALLCTSAVLDLLGGLGILLPSLTRIAPRVTVLAALGCAALMASAAVFHLSRGEAADTPMNIALAAVALFVAWGRHSIAPITPRR
ncbi:DoxX family protein [Streptomyces otsuchiensis]|uniref:DoxX family protein n=1 Tax=Streptomyces otsuchiensis TaxID=2681388 RepID=UPI001031B7B3|nr:DoxX family protein [Streptomyces otsuchiensis]